MTIRVYPDLVDVLKASLVVDVSNTVLDGGAYNQSAFAQFSEIFIDACIFDGGRP